MAYAIPRCQVVPVTDHEASVRINGTERLRWHFGANYPRPFFYPLISPSGAPLTRMGHPGAPNHDHHQSIWFAHEKVLGIDFWSNQTTAFIRQKQWLTYQDSDDEAVMAVLLEWFDGHDPRPLLTQELVAAVRPERDNETLVELQATFRPVAESLEFGKTHFGFLAVRVAKSLSAYFGGGQLTNSEGAKSEPAIFGKTAKWMDYSGPMPGGVTEGITYFDHPTNPGHPATWHVRDDGWMAASPCYNGPINITRKEPLVLRYLLHAHKGDVDVDRANKLSAAFASTTRYEITKAMVKHYDYSAARVS